jgi:hypothetical protein
LAHVGSHERRCGHLPGKSQESQGQIHAGTSSTRRLEGSRMPSSAARHIEHPPASLEWDGPEDEADGTLCIPVITMRIQPQVLFAKPFFEPFHCSY